MSKTVIRVVIAIVVLALVFGAGTVAGGGIVYALTRSGPNSGLAGQIRERLDGIRRLGPTITLASQDDQDGGEGLVIAGVMDDGPAAAAGVVRGDILLRLDDQTIASYADLLSALRDRDPGDTVTLTVLHGDDERTLAATLGDRDGQAYLGIVPCIGMGGEASIQLTVQGQAAGARVISVVDGSPADRAGLEAGDTITSVDGEALSAENDLAGLISAYAPGDEVTLDVTRRTAEGDGQDETLTLTVTLGEHPDDASRAYLGIEYRMLPFAAIEEWVTPEGDWDRPFGWQPGDELGPMPYGLGAVAGVVVGEVAEGGPAGDAGVLEGDLITAIDGVEVQTPQAVLDVLADHEPGDRVTLTVLSSGDDEPHEVEVTLGAHPDDEERAYLGVTIGGSVRFRRFGDGEEGELPFRFTPPFDFDFDFDFDFPLPAPGKTQPSA